jgi:hypothetical protein
MEQSRGMEPLSAANAICFLPKLFILFSLIFWMFLILGVCILLRVWDQGEGGFLPTILTLHIQKTPLTVILNVI